jgi:hypothetical protein
MFPTNRLTIFFWCSCSFIDWIANVVMMTEQRILCCNLCIFSFILLSVLLYLPAMTRFDLEVEIVLWVLGLLASIWFFAVSALQLSFYNDSCFIRIGLFMEFLCNLHRLVRSRNKSGLFIVLFELLIITIASCSVLLD